MKYTILFRLLKSTLKVEQGTDTSRKIRQWKKEVRDKYMQLVNEMNKLLNLLAKAQAEIAAEEENRRREAKRIEDEHAREIIRHRRG